jgi:hypothetical protein
MRRGRFGLMARPALSPGPQPEPGLHLEDPDAAVAAFDLDRFMADFRRTGAAWLIFPVGPGAARRDLAWEVAGRCRCACRKFIAALPVDAPGAAERRGAESPRELALRFGDLLDGWWFDGVPPQPGLYLEAARAGNPAAAVAFNDGSFCIGSAWPVAADQDYLAGETEALHGGKVRFGRDRHAPLLDPVTHDPQPPPGCLWHALIRIDGAQGALLYEAADLETVVRDFKAAGGAVTFSVTITPGGGLGAEAAAQLAELTRRLGARR